MRPYALEDQIAEDTFNRLREAELAVRADKSRCAKESRRAEESCLVRPAQASKASGPRPAEEAGFGLSMVGFG